MPYDGIVGFLGRERGINRRRGERAKSTSLTHFDNPRFKIAVVHNLALQRPLFLEGFIRAASWSNLPYERVVTHDLV
jgi:hypothetical protein